MDFDVIIYTFSKSDQVGIKCLVMIIGLSNLSKWSL